MLNCNSHEEFIREISETKATIKGVAKSLDRVEGYFKDNIDELKKRTHNIEKSLNKMEGYRLANSKLTVFIIAGSASTTGIITLILKITGVF